MSCIFCSIIKGEIPCHKIYEDDRVLAFLDISNDVMGHTLVVPKTHVSDMHECSNEEFLYVLEKAKVLVGHFIKLGFDGANIVINCKPAAGQEVGHLHVHVIPRKKGDGAKLTMQPASEKFELREIAKKLEVKD